MEAQELQLIQLPEGTEVQVRPVPLAFAYKSLGGQWTPIESDPAVYEPLFGDEFPLGSIAIDPEGIGYVKGFAGCPQHPQGPPLACLCLKAVCWIRAGRVRAPHPLLGGIAAQPAELNEDIAMGAVVPVQDFQADVVHAEPDIPSREDGLDGHHHPGPYLPAPGDYGQSTGNGDFGPYEMADEDIQPPPQPAPGVNHAVDNDLQEVRHADLGRDSYTIYLGQQGNGIPRAAVDTLDDQSFAFGQGISLGVKASIRFEFKYWQNIPALQPYIDRRPQVKIRRGSKPDGAPISVRAMAKHVFSELTAEMNTMAGFGYPLSHGSEPINIDELVLLRVERIKFGTLQPVFALGR